MVACVYPSCYHDMRGRPRRGRRYQKGEEMGLVVIYLATLGLSVVGSYYVTQRTLVALERRRMRRSIERIKAKVLEYAEGKR